MFGINNEEAKENIIKNTILLGKTPEDKKEESETQPVNENGRWLTPFEMILEKIETQNETIKQLMEEIKELKANKNIITDYEPEKPTPTLLKRVEMVEQKIMELIGDPFIKQNIKKTFEKVNSRIDDLEKLVNIEVKTIGQRTDNIFDTLKKHEEYITKFKQDIDEMKEQMFSLTKGVKDVRESEKMEQEEKGRKNKMYIVHRRTSDGTELYLGQPLKNGGYVVIYEQTGEKYKATKFTMEEAIKVRNEANKHCESCLMLWVISEVK